ncbi:hypothetical protein BDB00DRAFT_810024 [Zychaea mexicana]|uniref:uncharacterized protein n=1 Tax=Zychaea mexicana TaxID=64656 RepID=UPI0022FE30A2|nr:uncharacterized protein BDB00DRAFT_810024 [Zychaea mexicana]KAI9496341.1 hypothetical protein BDB00DRAFT_810024 [Zychaea mexicana]
MGDSFFGFNTGMPPLSEGELQKLESKEDNISSSVDESAGGAGNNHRSKNRDHGDDLEVYNFDALKDGINDYDDREVDDNLGDMLIDEGDDFNDETFGEASVGQDYDFFANTEKFNTVISEEEAFGVKRHPAEDQQQQQQQRGQAGKNRHSVGSSWGATDRGGAGTIGSRPASQDFRNQSSNQFKSSPVTGVQSIWGGFGGNISSSGKRTLDKGL